MYKVKYFCFNSDNDGETFEERAEKGMKRLEDWLNKNAKGFHVDFRVTSTFGIVVFLTESQFKES